MSPRHPAHSSTPSPFLWGPLSSGFSARGEECPSLWRQACHEPAPEPWLPPAPPAGRWQQPPRAHPTSAACKVRAAAPVPAATRQGVKVTAEPSGQADTHWAMAVTRRLLPGTSPHHPGKAAARWTSWAHLPLDGGSVEGAQTLCQK